MSTVNAVPNLRQQPLRQVREWMSPLNVHVAAAVVLLLLVLWLVIQLVLVKTSGSGGGAEAISTAQAQLAAAELAARPLRGLDTKLSISEAGADRFYKARMPFGYAEVAGELGALKQKSNIRLSRVQYIQAPPVNGLTEIRLDSAVTGDYRNLAQFINAMERDKLFFLINNISLNGQQGGIVNLRIRTTTFLRESMPAVADAQGSESGGRQ